MTTVEKLLVQIFERKKSIIELVNQHTESYRKHLASKSLIEGITPPSWLLNPNTSDSEELNKDELISKLLCPYPQPSARWSFAHYPGYNNLVITGDNEECCERVSVENPAFCKGLKEHDPTVPELSADVHAEGTLNCVPELDSSVTSPEDHTDERILNIYRAPDQSLAGIKRSKSRQKDLLLRSSAKARVKSLRHENAKDVVSNQIRFSLSATDQEGQNDDLSQLAEPHDIGGQCCEETNLEEADCTSRDIGEKDLELHGSAKAAKIGSRYENISDVVSNQIRVSLSATDQAEQNDELSQLAEPCEVDGQSCEENNLDEEDCTSREQRSESAKDVSSQIRVSLSATDQAGQNDELPQMVAEPRAFGGQCCEETNLEEADCTSREIGEKALELQGSAKAAKSGSRYENISDVVYNQIRGSLSATDQEGQNNELSQLAEPCEVGGQSCEEMNLDEEDCTSREQRSENAKYVSSQIRVSLSATDQAGQNDEQPQMVAEPRAFGGQCCEEMNLEEADCTSREIGEKALELQGSAKAAKSGSRYENISDVVYNQIKGSLSATDQAGQNNELSQLAEPCEVGGQSCEEMNLDEEDCTSREQRSENAKDVSSQIRVSLSATDQAGQNDEQPQMVAEPRAFGGQCCEETNLEEADCTSRKIGEKALELQLSAEAAMGGLKYEINSDVVSSQIRFCLSATDQAGQDDELPQSEEPCAVGGLSCEKMNLDEEDCTSKEMGMSTCSDMVTRSRSLREVPVSVKGSLTLDCSSEDCKENAFCHVAKSRRTEPMPISHSEYVDTCIDFSKSVGPSEISLQSCIERRDDDASFPFKDEETNVSGKITRSQISRKQQSCGSDSSKNDDSCDNYLGIDISRTGSAKNLTPETGDGPHVKVSLRNVWNEDHDTRTSVSEDSRRYKERDTLQSWSSSQHNTRIDAVSDLEASSFSAKTDGGILASSSGVSARQDIDSIEASQLAKPSIGLFRRLTRSQTLRNDKEPYQPMANSESPGFRSPIPKPDKRACLEMEVCSQHGDSSLGDNVLGAHTTVRLHGENSSLEGSLRHTSMDTWPQVKRRKIERQQANSFATSPSFQVKKHHSIHRGPVSTYLKPMEVKVDAAFVEHVNECTDVRIFPEMNSSLKEGDLSESGEVGSFYKEKNENKTSQSDVNSQQLEASLVSSLPLIESRNSQGCFLEGVRTSLSSSNLYDARMSGNEQLDEHLCNIEKSADNLNSEVMQSPKWEGGLHTQHSILSPSNEDLQQADVDQSIPVFEGFIVDSETNSGELNFAAEGFHFDELNLPRTTLERASILAEICRSASLDRLSYQFSSDFETQNIFQSVPNRGNLEHLGDTFPLSSDVGKHLQSSSSSSDDYKDTIDGLPYSVSRAYSGARYGWNSRNQYPSPVGKLWDRPSSYTGSSEKRLSSNPELTCFPIEEDPSSSQEIKEDGGEMQEEINSSLANDFDKRKPLKDLTNLNLSVSADEEIFNTDTTDFVSTKFSVTGTQENAQCDPRGQKYQYRNKSEVSENQTSSIGTIDGRTNKPSCVGANRIRKAKESTNNSISKPIASNKTSLKGRDQKLSLKESTRNNIVSNVSSFIPLVQQKQAAATACAGKRDVKVKALEAAEAAKRLEEKKENERKLRKEAMKVERAKLEEKNLRQMELEKKKKEEERKKKDADIIAKKRLREEEERKDKERKRMRPDTKQRQRENEERKRAEKAEKERDNHRPKDQQINSKESHDESRRQQSETTRKDVVVLQKAETKSTLTAVVMNHGECSTSVITGEVEKGMHSVDKSPRKEDLITQNNQVKSYEISPYQCSDDEDEDDDELPAKKFIPSWASKNSVAMFLPLQQKLDPDVIFPLESFCNMDEVLLPRKLQQSQVAT